MCDEEVHDIASIEFGIYSADEIRKISVCRIDNPKLTPEPGSVYDERMGCVPDSDESCVTCGLKKECWGHFGYIDLIEPVLHPMYHKPIVNFLKCFCKQCHHLLISPEQMELGGFFKLKGERRFNKLLEKLEGTNMCVHCSSPQPKIIYKSKDATISMEYKQKKRDGECKISIILGVDDIKKIFDDIPDEDVIMVGLDPTRIHPRNLVLTVLPVSPPCSRPYVIAEGNICDDDLTYQYIEIIKANNQLAEKKDDVAETPKDVKRRPRQKRVKDRQECLQTLKFRIQTLFNNSKGKAKHPTDSRPLKGLKERLAGKSGRIRSNLMGKRVNFSARTVIGAEPSLKLNQVGIPYEVAKIHTKPEVVTDYNIAWLTELVNNGKANFLTTKRKNKDSEEKTTRINLQYALNKKGTELLYGDIIVRGGVLKENKEGDVIIPETLPKGVTIVYVQSRDETLDEGDKLIRNGKYIEVKYPKKKRINLRIGDIVERQLVKGDIVLFNRQPTLHKGSMLSMEVVPMPHKSFRFNLAATKSFNADGKSKNVFW